VDAIVRGETWSAIEGFDFFIVENR